MGAQKFDGSYFLTMFKLTLDTRTCEVIKGHFHLLHGLICVKLRKKNV